MLPTILRRQCARTALPSAFRTLRPTSRFTKTRHTRYAWPLLPQPFPRPAPLSLPSQIRPSIGWTISVPVTTLTPTSRRPFHVKPRRQDDSNDDSTPAVSDIPRDPEPALFPSSAFTIVVLTMMGGFVLVFDYYRMRRRSLKDVRVERIIALIIQTKIDRKVAASDAADAAGAAGVKWLRWFARRIHAVVEDLSGDVVKRLKEDVYAANADMTDAQRSKKIKARGDRLLEMDREIARVVLGSASKLKREDRVPLIAHLVAVDVSDAGADAFAKALDESGFVAV